MYKFSNDFFGPTVKEVGAKAWLEDMYSRVERMNKDLSKLSKSKSKRSKN